mmetsp:Transcript_50318/g.45091  ORF Transcript_50318/g.45091 Transcript_50318/m.45091 type:complete len:443 (-) Transcript_50318:139-1467(-)
MATSLLTSLTLMALFVITKSQTYEDCGTATITTSGSNPLPLTLSLARDETNSMVKITISGSSTVWIGASFGQGGGMNGAYGITGEEDGTLTVKERSLQQYGGGSVLTSQATSSSFANGIVTLERPYKIDGMTGYFDFTDLLTCQVDSINFGLANGDQLGFAKHTAKIGFQTFTSSCNCPTPQPTTAEPSAAPTTDPTSDPTDAPLTKAPTTTDQTSDPSKEPSSAPTPAPIAQPSLAPADGYEQCATAELISGIKLNIQRNSDEQMIRIMMAGPNTAWFGYGFGSEIMTGAYGITVEGADATSFGIRERALDSSDGPGASLEASGSTSVISDGESMLAILERPYSSTNGGFDFTDFMTCSIDNINIIAAQGSTTTMEFHSIYTPRKTEDPEVLTRLSTCICDDDTSSSTSSTIEPSDGGSANNIFNVFNIVVIVFVSVYSMT